MQLSTDITHAMRISSSLGHRDLHTCPPSNAQYPSTSLTVHISTHQLRPLRQRPGQMACPGQIGSHWVKSGQRLLWSYLSWPTRTQALTPSVRHQSGTVRAGQNKSTRVKAAVNTAHHGRPEIRHSLNQLRSFFIHGPPPLIELLLHCQHCVACFFIHLRMRSRDRGGWVGGKGEVGGEVGRRMGRGIDGPFVRQQ